MVIALSSLVLTPDSGYAGGNLRPFITRSDSDVSLIADAVKRRKKVCMGMLFPCVSVSDYFVEGRVGEKSESNGKHFLQVH